PNVCLLAAGAPVAIAEIVTVVGPPSGVPAAAVTVNVTVTGVDDVGLTELDGENTPAAPPSSSASPPPKNFPPPLPGTCSSPTFRPAPHSTDSDWAPSN